MGIDVALLVLLLLEAALFLSVVKPASESALIDVDSDSKCVCVFMYFLHCLILSCKISALPASVKVEAHICQWIETKVITDIISLKANIRRENNKKNIFILNGKLKL